MAENTSIEWADHTFNPWIGCTKISPACDNCYAEALDLRFTKGSRWGAHSPRTRTQDSNWRKPRSWNKAAQIARRRYRVFCASLADVFDNHRSIDQVWRDDLWDLIRRTPNLDWLLLTKRPQNILKMLPPDWESGWKNVWLGTTVENQKEADRRIPDLLQVPAVMHFLSCEPILEKIDIERWLHDSDCMRDGWGLCSCQSSGGPFEQTIGWVITGGESGPNFRQTPKGAFEGLRDQCESAGVPFLFKQYGGKTRKAIKAAGRALDGVVHNGFPEG